MHYRRLLNSAQQLKDTSTDATSGGGRAPLDAITFGRETFLRLIKETLGELVTGPADYRVTVIFDPSSLTETLWGIPEVIPPNPAMVQVEIRRMIRHDPEIKSTRWVAERQAAEQEKSPASNEVILADAKGNLYEGLSSNFGVLQKSPQRGWSLLTAPKELVLTGSIMELVKIAAKTLGMVVIEHLPQIDRLHDYQGAFITSTSRLLLPVSRILGEGGRVEVDSINGDQECICLLKGLQATTLQLILSRSINLPD